MTTPKLTPPPPTGIGVLDRWLNLLWRKLTGNDQITWNQIDTSGTADFDGDVTVSGNTTLGNTSVPTQNSIEYVSGVYPSTYPSLNLNFSATKVIDPRITFSRASTATYFDANGVLQSAAIGTPRFDHDPVTKVCKGLLIEEDRTNLLRYSEQFDNAAWTKTNSTITANTVSAPDGATTADKLVETTAITQHIADQSFTFSATSYTFTIFAKAAERPIIFLAENSSGAARRSFFNLSTGAVGTTNVSHTANIQSVGNGWYRCSIVFTATAIASFARVGCSTTDNVIDYTGDGVSGLYIWGAQLEVGAFPTSYIPTTTTSLTRSADVASMTGTNFSDWYNQTEGTFVAHYGLTHLTGGANAMEVSDGTANERHTIRAHNLTGPNSYNFLIVDGGTPVFNVLSNPTNLSRVHTLCGAYKVSDAAYSYDGLPAVTGAPTTLPTVNRLSIGSSGTGSTLLNGHISRITYYNTRLSNAILQGLSA